ncbi:MAG: formate--tetrahydrofolate ligase, partial [Gammaproteobacteria bacterium]|nr:formate--tetrahydrofolate ligase [Gammaproteobacteria bacterium]
MKKVPSDIEIAQAAKKLPITKIADQLGIPNENLIPYGHDKAKINYDYLERLNGKPNG